MQSLLLLISIVLSTILYVAPESDTQLILEMQLVVYVVLIAVNYIQTKRFNLFQVWLAAFIFILHSEMLIIVDSNDTIGYLSPFFLFLMSNNLVLVGYGFVGNGKTKKRSVDIYQIYNKHRFAFLLVGLGVWFILGSIMDIQNNLLMGRQLEETVGSSDIFSVFTDAIGVILPALIAFMYRDEKGPKKWLHLVYVLPIFIVHIILATRFKLLFALVPYCIVIGAIDVVRPSKKMIISLLLVALVTSYISSFMKENRYKTMAELSNSNNYDEDDVPEDARWSVKLAAKMSPEGVIMMARYADVYFENHDLCYGKEIAHLFYRWVPRSLWKNKPMPIEHWLIRHYENVSEYHSTSSGYIGALRADFGWFSLLFAILIGVFLKKLDLYVSDVCRNRPNSIEIVVAAMIFAYVFFMVRSPITATYTFLYECVVYLIVKVAATRKNRVILNK